MNPISPTVPIKASGTFWFPQRGGYGQSAYVEVAGEFAGASFQIVYKDLAGNATPYKELDGTIHTFTEANFVWLDVPTRATVGLTVTGATAGTALLAAFHPSKDQ